MISPNKSHAPISLLKQVSSTDNFCVYFSNPNYNDKIIKIQLDSGNITIGQAIKYTIKKLNKEYKFNLNDDVTGYQLYGAKKNGKKKSDFPSLEHEQIVENTKLIRFHLVPLFMRKHSEETTITSIQSTMDIQKISPKKEIKTKKGFSCFFCH